MGNRWPQFVYYLRHPLVALKTPVTPRGMSPHSSLWNIVKWSLQRAWRGYSDWDVSEAGPYLTHIMANVVREYAKNREGWVPCEFAEDEYDGPTWAETLDVMVAKLRAGRDRVDDKYSPEVDAMWDKIPRRDSVAEYVKDDAMQAWHDAMNAERERQTQEWRDGMDMLKEHLWGMWV